MVGNKKVIVVLPAYNAARTLKRTIDAIPKGIADDIILVDDASKDNTVEVAQSLGLRVFVHPQNRGYGGNQKTCYREALNLGADIVVMLHPDFQYDPVYISQMVGPIARGEADAVFGSRMAILKNALTGGMPYWKFIPNIFLSFMENLVFDLGLSEYHTGFRAYSKKVLTTIPFKKNSEGFVFDAEIFPQLKIGGFRVIEIPISTRYSKEASSIGFIASINYGIGIFGVVFKYLLFKIGLKKHSIFIMNNSVS